MLIFISNAFCKFDFDLDSLDCNIIQRTYSKIMDLKYSDLEQSHNYHLLCCTYM